LETAFSALAPPLVLAWRATAGVDFHENFRYAWSTSGPTSTGGLEALKNLCSSWPPDLPASVFVVMHIGARPSNFLIVLQNFCALQVQHAADGERFEKSVMYIAPPDKHFLLFEDKTLLSSGPKENFTRPAADPLFRSAAVAHGQRVIGVVLTGDLDDGAAGAKAVLQRHASSSSRRRAASR
jgi:two-component system chemotaxis response regulator CheB